MRPRQRTAPDDGVVRTKRARQAVLKRVRRQRALIFKRMTAKYGR
jgi:hypothetical protein